jgi:hypothetical protein
MCMHDAGMGKNQLAGVFMDNSVPAVTMEVAQGVIDSHTDLGTRALPKQAANKAIKARRAARSLDSANGLTPA